MKVEKKINFFLRLDSLGKCYSWIKGSVDLALNFDIYHINEFLFLKNIIEKI